MQQWKRLYNNEKKSKYVVFFFYSAIISLLLLLLPLLPSIFTALTGSSNFFFSSTKKRIKKRRMRWTKNWNNTDWFEFGVFCCFFLSFVVERKRRWESWEMVFWSWDFQRVRRKLVMTFYETFHRVPVNQSMCKCDQVCFYEDFRDDVWMIICCIIKKYFCL